MHIRTPLLYSLPSYNNLRVSHPLSPLNNTTLMHDGLNKWHLVIAKWAYFCSREGPRSSGTHRDQSEINHFTNLSPPSMKTFALSYTITTLSKEPSYYPDETFSTVLVFLFFGETFLHRPSLTALPPPFGFR